MTDFYSKGYGFLGEAVRRHEQGYGANRPLESRHQSPEQPPAFPNQLSEKELRHIKSFSTPARQRNVLGIESFEMLRESFV